MYCLITTLRNHKAIKSPDEMETLQMELCDTISAIKLDDEQPAAADNHRRQADKDM